MSNFDLISHIDLIGNINISPIPLEFGDAMTTTKFLAGIQAKVNEIIDFRNSAVSDSKAYTDSQITILDNIIDEIKTSLITGNIIPDKSISVAKMSDDLTKNINDIVVTSIKNIAKIVNFGLNDDGYFYADIPSSWGEVVFSTDENGHLVLKY